MIWFKFQISNPWWKGKNDKPQKDYLIFDKMVTKNKFVEVQVSKWNTHELFVLSLDTCWFGQDHAGLEFSIEVLGYYFCIQFRDKRHWNYDEGRFMTDEEIQAEVEEWKAMTMRNEE